MAYSTHRFVIENDLSKFGHVALGCQARLLSQFTSDDRLLITDDKTAESPALMFNKMQSIIG